MYFRSQPAPSRHADARLTAPRAEWRKAMKTKTAIHPLTASCGMVSDKATWVIIHKVDLQIDSNNDGKIDAEDDIVEGNAPGRLLIVNNGDADNDGIIDNRDFSIDGEPLFTEAKLTISNFPYLENCRIFLSYDASTPPDTEGGALAGGSVRIWAKQSNEARSPLAVKGGGDFVAPVVWNGENYNEGYTAAELGIDVTSTEAGGISVGSGEVTLYLEGINSANAKDISVIVVSNLNYLWHGERFIGGDSAKTTTFDMPISLLEAEFTGGRSLSGEHMNSHGLPLVLNDDFDGHQANPANAAFTPDNEDARSTRITTWQTWAR
jgi:hypothetical protein